jgi:hypothetical protein
VDNSRPHTGKCLLSEAISRQKCNSSMPSRILEPLRNNSVCHKSGQSGSGATKSEVDSFPVYQNLAAVPACRLPPHFASVVCEWPDLVNAGRPLPIENVSQLPGVSHEINLQFPLLIDLEFGRRIQNARALALVRIVQVEFAGR